MRRRWVFAAVAVAIVVVAAIAFVVVNRGGGTSAAQRTTDEFVAAWSRGDSAAMGNLLDVPPANLSSLVGSLSQSAPGTTFSVRAAGVLGGDRGATAGYHAHIDMPNVGGYDFDGQLTLVKTNAGLRVQWTPAVLLPGLVDGQRLALRKTWPERAPILGADGSPLVSNQDAVTVGLEPDHIQNLDAVKTTLQQLLHVNPAAVDSALAAPGVKPNFFVPIITLRTDVYTPLRPQLAPVPGVVFQKTRARFAVRDGLAAQTLGRVGPVTAERLKQLGSPYDATDTVGLSGLELVDEARLAGRPKADLDVVDDKGNVVRTLQTYPGVDPQPVQTTLDATTQMAAEDALQTAPQPAALVAVDPSSGQIRAVVSTPTDQDFNRALDGQYPPGSTFKIVTGAALLAKGDDGNTPAPCPPNISVGGKQFTNFEGETNANLALHQAFALSCNTAFIGLVQSLPAGALDDMAKAFGFGANYELSLPTTGGSFPSPSDDTERAAAAIGQGRVTASPLHMATVAAAVASGQWRPPTLLLQPPPPAAAALPQPLTPQVVDELRPLMREVVTSGTGTAANVPGDPVSGKTGTAEFGSGNPPSTHAWFVGFRDNLAFAVLVEGGGVGGQVAAPVAATFLNRMR